MKKILVSYGLQKYYPVDLLQSAGAELSFIMDSHLPFPIRHYSPLDQDALYYDDVPLLKDNKPAIPQLYKCKNADGKVRQALITREDKMLCADEIDLFIPSVGVGSYETQMPFLKFIESHNIPTLESSTAIETAMHKHLTYAKLHEYAHAIPDHLFIAPNKTETDILNFYRKHNGKIIIKKSFSHFGKNIFLPKNEDEILQIFHDNKDQPIPYIMQQKINIPQPLHHLRVALAFGKIIAMQKFYALPDAPTSHVGKHHHVESIILSPENQTLCDNMAKTLDVSFCSLDCLLSTEGDFYMLEANVTPAIKHWFPEQPKQMIQALIEKYF